MGSVLKRILFFGCALAIPALFSAPKARYLELPLRFEPNVGQAGRESRFLAYGSGYMVLLNERGFDAVESSAIDRRKKPTMLRFRLEGSASHPVMEALERAPSVTNYYRRANFSKTAIPNFDKLAVRGVYPGIDMFYYRSQGRLEYDFVVAPGSNPQAIQIAVQTAGQLRISQEGDLVAQVGARWVRQRRPHTYQLIAGRRREVESRYRLASNGRLSFEIGLYDRSRSLTIDPILDLSSFPGFDGGGERTLQFTSDAAGNTYFAGPVAGSNVSVEDPTMRDADVLIAKYNAGGELAYKTLVGGSGDELALAVSATRTGQVAVSGMTAGGDLGPTAGAFRSPSSGQEDGWVAQLDETGKVEFLSILGGAGSDQVNAITHDQTGNIWVAGQTASLDFPVTPEALDAPAPGTPDAFVARLSPDGHELQFSRRVGGSGSDRALAIALDAAGRVLIAGVTSGADFPTTEGAFNRTPAGGDDAFVAQLNQRGDRLRFSTLVGGPGHDTAYALAIGPEGDIYLAGGTTSKGFAGMSSETHATPHGGEDVFVVQLDSLGTELTYATFLGGAGLDRAYSIAVDESDAAYVTGVWSEAGDDLILRPSAFVAKLSQSGEVVYSAPLTHQRPGAGTSLYLTNDHSLLVAGYLQPLPIGEEAPSSTFVSRVNLAESPCPLKVSPQVVQVPATGGIVSISVIAPAGCAWAFTSNSTWVVATSGSNGQGNGTIVLEVQATNAQRSTSAAVGDQQLRIVQSATTSIFEPQALSAARMFAVDGSTGSGGLHPNSTLYTLDPNTGKAISVSPNPTSSQIVGIAFHPITGELYGVTSNQDASKPRRLVKINLTTGIATAVGADMGVVIRDLAFDGNDLYGWGGTHGTGNERLYRINTASGTAAPVNGVVGGNNTRVSGAGLAHSPGGVLHQVGLTAATLNTIAKSNGSVTGTTPLSGSADTRFLSLEYSPSGELFGITRPGDVQVFSPQTKLVVVNPSSGQITLRGNTAAQNGAGLTINAIAIQLCSGSAGPTSFVNVAQAGGTLAVTINTASGCFWTATSNNSDWITPSVTSGSGGATVNLIVLANSGAPRTGTVTVAGETITVSQVGAVNSCQATVTPNPATVGAGAGTQVETIAVAAGCSWTAAVVNTPWLTIQGATSGIGNGSVTLNVGANTGPPRSGTVSIAGQGVTVNQQSSSNSCPVSLFPNSLTAGAAGSPVFGVHLTGQVGCTWVASSNAPWLTGVSVLVNGSGRAVVTFAIAANAGAARTGTLTIAGQTFEVTQQASGGPCLATLQSAGSDIPSGVGAVPAPVLAGTAVNLPAGCAWSTTNAAPWITVTNGSGSGTGTMTFNATANSGPPRTSIITVGGQPFTVLQEGLVSTTLYAATGTPRDPSTSPASTLYTINPATGAVVSTLGSTGFVTSGLAIHPTTGDLYATNGRKGASPNRLLKLNRATGAGTIIGPLGNAVHELAFDANGSLYGWGATFDGGDYDLQSININTGAATKIAESGISLSVVGGGLTFDLAGDLHYANQLAISPNFYKVNKSTGALTQQFSLTGTDSKVVAMDLLGSGPVLALTHELAHRSQVANLWRVDRALARLVAIGRTVDYTNGIAALNCIGFVSPSTQQVSGSGSALAAGIVISQPCDWSAQSNVSWITFPQSTGKGQGALQYSVAANAGSPRSGTITVAGQTITITQDGGLNACPATLTPSTQTVAAAAGSAPIQVTVAAGCPWSTVSNASWITLSSPVTQTGAGSASLQFTANAGAPRTGTVSIAGQTFTLTQQSPVNFCAATIQPTSQTVDPAAANLSIPVTVAANCAWSASTALPWVTIGSGATGTGNGAVGLNIAANSGAAERNGTVAIAGQTFTVTQRSPLNACPATLTPSSQDVPVGGGPFQAGIAVAVGCQWAATGGTNWLTITGPVSGTGTATIGYTVAANNGYPRSATLTIAGRTFRVSQAGTLAGTLYVATGGGGGSDSRLYQIEPSTGNIVADIGQIGYPVTGLAFHPITRQLYGSTNNRNVANGRKLLRINRATAAATEVGPLALADGSIHDMAFDAAGNLFAVSSQRSFNDLYRIDINNGVLSRVGEAYPFQTPGNAVAFASDGTLYYGARSVPEDPGDPRSYLKTVNPFNGDLTYKVQVSGRTPPKEKFSGFDYDNYGTLFGFVLPEQFASPSSLVTVNTTSGVITTIGRTIDNANALAFYPSACAFSVSPAFTRLPLTGGTITLNVTGAPECAWTAASTNPRLQVNTPSGAGSGSVAVTVLPSSGAAAGSITVAGKTIQIAQTPGLRFVPVSPCRLVDTRENLGAFGKPAILGSVSRNFTIPDRTSCGIPANSAAYSLNVTVVPKGRLGYVTIWPAGDVQPFVSTLNSIDGRIKANAAVVLAGQGGAVSVYASEPTELILDINGYFIDPAENSQALSFYPINPCRVMDTRNPTGALGGPAIAAGGSRNIPVLASSCGVPATAQAYSVNATVVPTGPLGFLTLWASGFPQPFVSTLNAPTGTIVANAAIVPAGAGGAISAFASGATNLVVDINGYFAPPGAANAQRFFALAPCRLLDTRGSAGEFGGPVLGAAQVRSYRLPLTNCGLPAVTSAYSLNATVVPTTTLGYLTLWPLGTPQPLVSTLNALDDSIVANAAIVPAGTSGAITSFANSQTHLILDTNGYFAP